MTHDRPIEIESPPDRPGQGMSTRLFWVVVAAAAAVVVIGVVFSQRLGSDAQPVAFAVKGQQVASIEVPLLETEGALDIADLKGDIVVVNFWASWCLSCRVEHGTLLAGAAAYRDSGVTFVGVNHQDRFENAVGFLDQLGRSPQTIYVEDSESRLALEFGVLGLPETFFVDREGTIVGKVSGALTPDVLTDTIDAIVLGEDVGAIKTGEVENRDG